ncbi:MAG TPA: hypothetical protein VML91_01775 [Burkholderiales bacterium]|nr:hypothetical protein [Burkholderiales bacterium]
MLLGLGAALLAAGTVAAQTIIRALPDDAPRAYLSHLRETLFSIDGRETKLAPGGQIRGRDNLLVLPAAVPKDSLVKYQLDKSGELYRAWILTKEEAARPDRFSPASAQGRPVEQVLPQYDPPAPRRFGAPPPPPADTPTRSTN